MTIDEAEDIRENYDDLTNPTEEETAEYIGAMQFFIAETNDPDYINELGATYYEFRQFDLALKTKKHLIWVI